MSRYRNREEMNMFGDWFEKGLVARKEVLTAEYVDQALEKADEFTTIGRSFTPPTLSMRERASAKPQARAQAPG